MAPSPFVGPLRVYDFVFAAKEVVVVVVFQAYNYWAVGVGSLLGLLFWMCWLQETGKDW